MPTYTAVSSPSTVTHIRQSMVKACAPLDVGRTGFVGLQGFMGVVLGVFPSWTQVDAKMMLKASGAMVDGVVDYGKFTDFVVCSRPGHACSDRLTQTVPLQQHRSRTSTKSTGSTGHPAAALSGAPGTMTPLSCWKATSVSAARVTGIVSPRKELPPHSPSGRLLSHSGEIGSKSRDCTQIRPASFQTVVAKTPSVSTVAETRTQEPQKFAKSPRDSLAMSAGSALRSHTTELMHRGYTLHLELGATAFSDGLHSERKDARLATIQEVATHVEDIEPEPEEHLEARAIKGVSTADGKLRRHSIAAIASAAPVPNRDLADAVSVQQRQKRHTVGGLTKPDVATSLLEAARIRHEACVSQLHSIAALVRGLETENSDLRSSKEKLRITNAKLLQKVLRLEHDPRFTQTMQSRSPRECRIDTAGKVQGSTSGNSKSTQRGPPP